MYQIDIMTLFDETVGDMMNESILGRAQERDIIRIEAHQIRDYTRNKQKQVDNYPYGGGRGAVLQADPLYQCWKHITDTYGPGHTIYLSPAGKTYTQADAKRLLKDYDHLILVCGHYEGIDERVIEAFGDEEISIGDYVLTGGELASLVVADSVLRLQPGVLAEAQGFQEESHWDGLLEYPQYTRPEVWEGRTVPPVLLTGDHERIAGWRARQSHERTMNRRPDLYEAWCRTHPLTPGRWKRSERAALIRTEPEWAAAAEIYTAGWQQLCADVCTADYLAAHTTDFMKRELQADRAAGWAFYLHSTAGEPDALVGVCHRTGEIGRLYVAPQAQGRGIGAKLLAFARKKLAEHPRPFLTVLDCNRRAIALYLRMGFRPSGVHAVYDPAQDPAASAFCRELKFVYTPSENEGDAR